MRSVLPFSALLAILALGACSAGSSEVHEAGSADQDVKVDTRTAQARRQYDANVAFANAYVPRCAPIANGRPRVIVTGFGRFLNIDDNATGRIVSQLVPGAVYPETSSPPAGEVDDPAPQLSVGQTTIEFEGVGPVDVCGVILPVYWDLAAILIAKETEAFEPDFVMMNGVAGSRQPLWIELGATNRAVPLEDGSDQLRPSVRPNEPYAKIIDTATSADMGRPNLLSWNAVKAAAVAAVDRHADEYENGVRFGDLLLGAELAGFPRLSNTYLCNNVTYVTGWVMSHPDTGVRLMRAWPPKPGAVNDVTVRLTRDFSQTPRVFVHWPSELASAHHVAGADVMKAIIGAQLQANTTSEPSTLGDNLNAEPSLRGGAFY